MDRHQRIMVWVLVAFSIYTSTCAFVFSTELRSVTADSERFQEEIQYLEDYTEELEEENVMLHDKIWHYHDVQLND